jgi:PAS domain S-box-containing protein
MLCILGIAAAAAAYIELGMMTSATAAEYGEWMRWYHLPIFLALVAQVAFVHYYLGTARAFLMWAVIAARSIILVADFVVHPNVNFSSITSLSKVTLFGEQVSAINGAVLRTDWQWFAVASVFLLVAFLVDAVIQQWRKGDTDSRRKALAISVGIIGPMIFTIIRNYLILFDVLHAPVIQTAWFVGALLIMAYELGRDTIVSRCARLEIAELRSALAQAERVSIMGQLASALAHELAQPLAATAANVEAGRALLKRENPDIQELDSILDDIGKDDHRATEIIGHMRQLFKRRTIQMQPLSIEDVMQDVVSLVRPEATSKQVALRLFMQPKLPRVLGDSVHLSQVLLNLLMNGIHAVQCRTPDARTIVVEVRSDEAKGEVEIAVRDSGPGIPDSMAEQVFKPFFTTKSDGMGMGLALSRMIIAAHGGRLWTVHNPQQEGAVFCFTLRRVVEQVANVETQPKIENQARHGGAEHGARGVDADAMAVTGVDGNEAVDRPRIAREALRDGEEQGYGLLASIGGFSHDAIVSKNLDGVIMSWNTGAESLFGYSAEEVLGRPITILFPEGRSDEELAILECIKRGESLEHYETIRRRKDGGLIDISLTISALRDVEGKVIGASKIARNAREHNMPRTSVNGG